VKRPLWILLSVMLVAAFVWGCKNQPQVRVTNQIHSSLNLTLSPTTGSTVTLNGIDSSTTSNYVEIPPGTYVVHVAAQALKNPVALDFTFVNDKKYTILVTVLGDSTATINVQEST